MDGLGVEARKPEKCRRRNLFRGTLKKYTDPWINTFIVGRGPLYPSGRGYRKPMKMDGWGGFDIW